MRNGFKRSAALALPILLVVIAVSVAIGFSGYYGKKVFADPEQNVLEVGPNFITVQGWENVRYTFVPEKTSYYEFSFVQEDWGIYKKLWDTHTDQYDPLMISPSNEYSFIFKFDKDEVYTLDLEGYYNDWREERETTVTISEYTPSVTSGACGENATWSYDLETDTLTIGGSGKMYDYVKNLDEVTETKTFPPWDFFTQYMKNLVIGEEITYIGEFAFYDCKGITSLTIPDKVTSVGKYAFENCRGLASVTIGSGMKEIAYGMFFNCTNLNSVTLSPDGVITKIGAYSFGCCETLVTPPIPSTVTYIGDQAFSSCMKLIGLDLPPKLEYLGAGAFNFCSSIDHVEIPTGITAIASSTFSHCSNLSDITIPPTVESIGNGAFESCGKATQITIPDGVTFIGESAFAWCYHLESIKIPDGIETISDYAFEGCQGIDSITIPSSVTSIGDYAFYMTCIKDLVIPGTVQNIGKCAFGDCDELQTITIGEGVRTIGTSAFYSCNSLNTVYIPASVESIGDLAFEYSSVKDVTIENGRIGAYAFRGCNLEKLTLGEGVTIIGAYAFTECNNISNDLVIPASVTIIGEFAFNECDKIPSITIKGATEICRYAFYCCRGAKELTLAEGVETIGFYAFGVCNHLTSVTIPSTVKEIDECAFNSCYQVTDVYCYADPENLTWVAYRGDASFIYSSDGVRQTICHVYEKDLALYEDWFSNVNVTFVGDLAGVLDQDIGTSLYGYSLSLDGDIGVNFYMELDSEVAESPSAYMLFTVPNGDKTTTQIVYVNPQSDVDLPYAKQKTVDGKIYHIFKCTVAAKDISSVIRAQVVLGESRSKTYNYSVKSYAEYLISHQEVEEYAKAADLARALLTYGSWAQKYFNVNQYNLDTDYLNYETLNTVTVDPPEKEFNIPSGVTYKYATLSLKSETTLSLYFSSDMDLEFSCGNKKVEKCIVDGYQVVRIRGIKASELGNRFTVKISCSAGSGTATFSVMNYCYNILQGDYKDDLKYTVRALCNYYEEAYKYSVNGGSRNE
ncbi:MAG: leucine-rich repeat domain-containing protein [Clostridiales bacterium]|nr:leucine-rich repeat domain-containing protein [Clostridiales bacterium]